MNIGNRIKELRTELSISSLKLAEKLNIPVRTIGSYERNEASPGIKFLKALNEQYNVNLNWLITGTGNMYNISNEDELKNGLISGIVRSGITSREIEALNEILNNDAAKSMLMKFLEVRRGNKEAIDELIQNLIGIKSIL